MAHFSLIDLNNRPGEVVEAAFRGPVEITRRGKRKFEPLFVVLLGEKRQVAV